MSLILAESALETLPPETWRHPLVIKQSKKRGIHPGSILLDRSYHHKVMELIDRPEKRGRPDIVHFALLEALGSPLNREGLLRVYVHTIADKVINIRPETRLPRNYVRFTSLIEQLFNLGSVPPEGESLLWVEDKKLSDLIREISPSRVTAFSSAGKPCTIRVVVTCLRDIEHPAIVIGGFPHGSFSEEAKLLFDEVYRIDREVLDAFIVVSRVIYEYETLLSISEKRLKL
ncbi:MAG: 16S rRNA methyltransferase [Candidatus Bathyarchaeia archaeon]